MRVTYAYKTASTISECVLVKTVPIDLIIQERERSYDERHNKEEKREKTIIEKM